VVRLSIIIPALNQIEELESTLVAVLANRPPHSEVIVVLSAPYADPYALADEVRFVEARQGAGWAESVNAGLVAAHATIAHVLSPGAQVSEGWTAAVLRHFDDPRVAAVTPLVLDAADPTRVLAAGVVYRASGQRGLAGAGLSASVIAEAPAPAIGPTHWAGFYRRTAVERVGGLAVAVGDQLADVDLAFRLKYTGYRAVSEPLCQVRAPRKPQAAVRRFRQALEAERFFWRRQVVVGGVGSLVRHGALWTLETVRGIVRGAAPATVLGRICGLLEIFGHRRHGQRLRMARSVVVATMNTNQPPEADQQRMILRIDGAHRAPSRTRGIATERRKLAA